MSGLMFQIEHQGLTYSLSENDDQDYYEVCIQDFTKSDELTQMPLLVSLNGYDDYLSAFGFIQAEIQRKLTEPLLRHHPKTRTY